MPTHRAWSRKANRQIKSLFRNFLNQDAPIPSAPREPETLVEKIERSLKEFNQRERKNGGYHEKICRTFGPPRTCEEPPARQIVQAEEQVVAAEEPKEEEQEEVAPKPRVALLQAISEIEGIKDKEIQAIEAILQGEDHKVNADNTLLIDLPICKPAPNHLDGDICEQIIFDLDVLWPTLL